MRQKTKKAATHWHCWRPADPVDANIKGGQRAEMRLKARTARIFGSFINLMKPSLHLQRPEYIMVIKWFDFFLSPFLGPDISLGFTTLIKRNQRQVMKGKFTWAKNFCSATALVSEYIIQCALCGIFSFMFNLCQMSHQEESLTSLMGLQLKKRKLVGEKIVPKWQHFEILMPGDQKEKITFARLHF